MKLTPVIMADTLDASLAFWVDRLGWQKTVEVPYNNAPGFIILAHQNAELMIQTFASAQADVPTLAFEAPQHRAFLFIEVDDWDDVVARLQGYPIQLPERTTFYGMREIGVVDPAGHSVIFAKPILKSSH